MSSRIAPRILQTIRRYNVNASECHFPIVLNVPQVALLSSKSSFPNIPKRPPNAYTLYVKEQMAVLGTDGPGSVVKNMVKIAEQYRALSAADKQVYMNSAEAAKAEYQMEMAKVPQHILLAQKEKNIAKKKRNQALQQKREFQQQYAADLATKPKMPPGGYILFCQQAGLDGFKQSDKWNSLPQHEKEKYQQQATELRTQYDVALNKWEADMLQQGKTALVRKKVLKTKAD